MPGLPPFKVTVGKYDYTYEAENVTFSSVDPGGCEMASFDLESSRADYIYPGDRVTIMDGVQTIWQGRVAEPAKNVKHGYMGLRKVGAQSVRVSCEGAGAALKDNQMSMIYIDRDLTRWSEGSTTRQANEVAASAAYGTFDVAFDPGGGPSLVIMLPGAYTANSPLVECFYNAGPTNLIGSIYYQQVAQAMPASWNMLVYALSDDLGTVADQLAAFTTTPHSGYATLPTPRRYLDLINNAPNTTNTSNAQYLAFWKNLAVYGNHNLTRRGADPGGFYVSDIASHVLQQANAAGAGIAVGQIDAITGFIVQHYVQYTPVAYDQIMQDMAKLGPCHYGVWENSSIFDDRPEFTVRAYTTEADYFMALADSNEADVSERLANLYTTAVITYQDSAGVAGLTTVSLPNSVLDRVGIKRTVTYDLGISNSAVAATFASFVLQLLYVQAVSAGSVELPRRLRDHNGALVPSYKLKAGINRIRINDLPNRRGMFPAADTDSFRISRIESTVDSTSGEVISRVELDSDPNLIETLQSRLDEDQGLF